MSAPQASLLRVESMSVSYAQVLAVRDFSLEMQRGEVIAIVGPNGAGKTSALRGIAGFLAGESAGVRGRVWFDGRSMAGVPPFARSRAGISLVLERDKVFPGLNVAEHLAISGAGLAQSRNKEIVGHCLDVFPKLDVLMNRPAGMLSGGERQMVAISCALLAEPKLLLVDELSQGLAPAVVASLASALRRLQREGGFGMIVVEQNPALAAELAQRMIVLDGGETIATGTPQELVRTGAVASAYLGLAEGGAGP